MPHAIKVTPANTTDRDGAIELFGTFRSSLQRILVLFCDGGYTGENFANAIGDMLGAAVEIYGRQKITTSQREVPPHWTERFDR